MITCKLLASLTLVLGFESALIAKTATESLEEKLADNSVVTSSELSDIESEVTRGIQLDPYSTENYYLLAKIFLKQLSSNPADMKKIHATSEISQHILELDASSELGYLLSAEIMKIMGYAVSSKQLILEAMNEKFTPGWRTHLYLATQEPLASAEHREHLSNALKHHDVGSQAYEMQIELLTHDGKLSQAKKIAAVIGSSLAHLEVVRAIEASSAPSALKYFEENIPRSNQHFKLEYLQLKGKTSRLSGPDISTLKSDDFDEKGRLKADMILGNYYLKRNEDLANKFYVRVIKNSDNTIKEIYAIKKIYQASDMLASYVHLLEDVKKNSPGLPEVYALQAELISEMSGDLNIAIEVYSDAILLDPYRSEYYTGIGLVYYKQKRYTKALNLFSKATSINPMDATAFYNKACMNSILGSNKKAIDDLAVAIELDPTLKETAINDSDLEEIRNSNLLID